MSYLLNEKSNVSSIGLTPFQQWDVEECSKYQCCIISIPKSLNETDMMLNSETIKTKMKSNIRHLAAG